MNEEDEKFGSLTPKDQEMMEIKSENSPIKGELVQFPARDTEKPKETLADRFFRPEAQASVSRMLNDLDSYQIRLERVKLAAGNRIKPETLSNFNATLEAYKQALKKIEGLPMDTPTESKVLSATMNTGINIERQLAELERLV